MNASPIERIALGAYRVAVQESGWTQLLDDVRTILDAKTAILLAPRRAAPVLMVGPSDFTRAHRDKVIAMPDPWDERLAQLRQSRPTGGCRIGSSYLPFRDLRRSGYFDIVTDEEMQVGPLVTLYIEGDDSGSGLPPTRLTVVRGPREPDFTEETARLLLAIHAPLRAAVRNYWAFARIRQLERAPEIAYNALPQPVLVLRTDGGIEYANAAADAILVRGDLLSAAGGYLVRAGSYGSATLGLLLAAASRGMTQQVAICASAHVASAGAVLHLARLPPENGIRGAVAMRYRACDGAVAARHRHRGQDPGSGAKVRVHARGNRCPAGTFVWFHPERHCRAPAHSHIDCADADPRAARQIGQPSAGGPRPTCAGLTERRSRGPRGDVPDPTVRHVSAQGRQGEFGALGSRHWIGLRHPTALTAIEPAWIDRHCLAAIGNVGSTLKPAIDSGKSPAPG